MTDLAEMCGIMEEATKVFADNEDSATLAKCVTDEKGLRNQWSKELGDGKALIKALTAELAATGKSVLPLETAEAHEAELDSLDANKYALAKQLNREEGTLSEKDAEIRALEAEIIEMQQDIASGAYAVAEANPKLDLQYSLYGMVSNIQWLPTEKGSHRIQGTASNQSLADQLRNFSLDTTRQSEQWITDHLWDLVSPVA
eukprot:m.348858 g.348858  ORF g.348858 m.348858 type:complete len:201 (-) comp16563_c2_seq12:4705-5307(-)